METIIIASIILALIAGGLGIVNNNTVIWFYSFLPVVLWLATLIKKRKIVIPPAAGVFYAVFLIFSLIAALNFSVDKETSFGFWLFYFSCFLIFVYFYNNKDLGRRLIGLAVFFGGLVFLSAAGLKNYFPVMFIPQDGYNLFYGFFENHNHLGDFLGLAMIWFMWDYLENGKKRSLATAVFLLVPIFLSHSRSSYLGLFFVFILMLAGVRGLTKKQRGFFPAVVFIVVLAAFLFVTSVKIGRLEKFRPLVKDIFSARRGYVDQSIRSIREKPFFGVGAGNFRYASEKYAAKIYLSTDTSHNIFADSLVENGLLAWLPILIFFLLIFKKAVRQKSVYSWLFLYLFLNFQTDYSYRIYPLYFLFIVICAVVWEEGEIVGGSFLYGVFAVLVFLIGQMVFAAAVLTEMGKYGLSQKIYPLGKTNYPWLINEAAADNDYRRAKAWGEKCLWVSPVDAVCLEVMARFYGFLGLSGESRAYYERLYSAKKFPQFAAAEKIYLLGMKLGKKNEANRFMAGALNNYLKNISSWERSTLLDEQISRFCLNNPDFNCPPRYFYEPKAGSIEKPNPWVSFGAKNTINNDGLNERFDYRPGKSKDSLRIVVLGGSSAYGLYVDTKDNWPERLEDLLNQNPVCSRIKKYEVINLGMHGYDIQYAVERYLTRGKKYRPDLIVWMVSSAEFYQLNELMAPKIQKYDEELKRSGRFDKFVKRKKYYPAWERGYNEVKNQLGPEALLKRQKKFLDEFRKNYGGKTLFLVSPDLDRRTEHLLLPDAAAPIAAMDGARTEYHFPDEGSLNRSGHRAVARQVYSLLAGDKKNLCR